MSNAGPWIDFDPAAIAEGLRSGLIKLTTTDDALRTPLMNAWLRQVADILAVEYQRQADERLTSSAQNVR